jgi:hypothetical protein
LFTRSPFVRFCRFAVAHVHSITRRKRLSLLARSDFLLPGVAIAQELRSWKVKRLPHVDKKAIRVMIKMSLGEPNGAEIG